MEGLKSVVSYRRLSSLNISANHRPDYCRDSSRNRDSVMISDDITDSLASLLKVSYQNKIFISVESLHYFKENQKGRKRSDRHIITKFLPKRFKARKALACVRSCLNEVSQIERYLFSKVHILVRDDKHVNRAGLCSFRENIRASLVEPWFVFWRVHSPTVSPKYMKPWLDQIRPDIFPN